MCDYATLCPYMESRTLSGGGKVHLCSSILFPYKRRGWDKKTRERERGKGQQLVLHDTNSYIHTLTKRKKKALNDYNIMSREKIINLIT